MTTETWAVIAIAVVVIILVVVGAGLLVFAFAQSGRRRDPERFESRYERESLSSGTPSSEMPAPPQPPVPAPQEPTIKWGDDVSLPREPKEIKWGDDQIEEPPPPLVRPDIEDAKCVICKHPIDETSVGTIICSNCSIGFHQRCWESADPSKTKCPNCREVIA